MDDADADEEELVVEGGVVADEESLEDKIPLFLRIISIVVNPLSSCNADGSGVELIGRETPLPSCNADIAEVVSVGKVLLGVQVAE